MAFLQDYAKAKHSASLIFQLIEKPTEIDSRSTEGDKPVSIVCLLGFFFFTFFFFLSSPHRRVNSIANGIYRRYRVKYRLETSIFRIRREKQTKS